MAPAATPTPRIVSLDQFRGYTVLGMLLVNFVGGFAGLPLCVEALQHVLQLRGYDHAAVLLRGRIRVSTDFREACTDARTARSLWPHGPALLGLLLVSFVIYTVDISAESWSQLVDQGFWPVICVRSNATGFRR